MNEWITNFFFENWQRKGIALILAIITWFIVNHSITITKTIPNVPIRIINIPADKTIEGLLPSGFLKKGVTLTLTGSKTVLEHLETGDLEILQDASKKDNEWVTHISKKNLTSLNPDLNLSRSIDKIEHSEFIIKMSKLITEKIPVRITKPVGEPPEGYQFLDLWPQEFYHTISGPQNSIEALKKKGIDLTFSLDAISKFELDHLQSALPGNDEIFFFIPQQWKKINLPFNPDKAIEINDPNAYNLHIVFLRKEYLPIERKIPVSIFFPFYYTATINPEKYTLQVDEVIEKRNGIYFLNMPLYARNVSRQFIEIIRDHLQLTIIAAPKAEKRNLEWNINFITPVDLENLYVTQLIPHDAKFKEEHLALHEQRLRNRFRDYMRKFTLFTDKQDPLELDILLKSNTITVDNGALRK